MEVTSTLLVGSVLALGGVGGLVVGYVARRQRDHPAADALSMMAILPGLAGLSTAATVVLSDPGVARGLLAVSTALLFLTPAYFLEFTLIYTGRKEWATPRRKRLLVGLYAAVGAVTMLEPLALTEVTMRTVDGLTLPVMAERTVIVVATLAFVYPLIGGCFVLLGTFLLSSRNIYRRQTAVIILAVFSTVVGNVVFEAGFSPHPGLNLTAVFFSLEVIVIALALFRFDFLRVEPLAPAIVLEEMDDPVFVLSDDESIVDTNPAASRLLGGQSPIGTPLDQWLPGLLAAAESGDDYIPETGPVRTDGGEVEVYDLNHTPIRDQYDRDRGWVVVLRDITLQKQRERTLQQFQSVSQQFLGAKTTEEVLAIAVEAADELLDYPYSGAMVYDPDEEVLCPAAFTDPLRAAFRESDVDGEPVVEPGDNDIWQVFTSGEPMLGDPIGGPELQLPIDLGGSLLYPLGEHGVLGISAGPTHDGFSDDDRRFAETLATTTENALDRVEKERQLRESRELLETRSRQMKFFNSALRHDLLNALMVVQGHVEQLDDLVDDEAAEHVETIDEWTHDIATMAKEVRSVTKTVTGEAELDIETVDIGAVLTEKARKFRQGHDRLTVTVDADGVPGVRADSLLGSVVENLFRNAIEHNDSETPEITATATTTGETVTVRIADNGPGIDDEMKETIFQKEVTSETSGSVGFGLYFVRVMLDRYGGDVWFEDRADGQSGTVAVLELPAAE